MFCQISDGYQLVGWKNLPTGILDVNRNELSFLPREEYRLLLHMNGQEDIDLTALTPAQQEAVRRFQALSLIQVSDWPFPPAGGPLYHFHDHYRVDSVQWSVTGHCNYHCRHCFLSSPEACTADLTTTQCLDVIRQMADCGIRRLSLTGGEPLVRADLPELIRACSAAGIGITEIYTNGALLTPDLLELLSGLGQRPRVQVSYDGVGWHDWVRGVSGAQQHAEKALLLAHDAGFETGAAMCLFRDNIPAIRETVRRLASLSVNGIKISPMLSLGLWGAHYAEKTLSGEEFLQAVTDYIPSFIADGKPCNLRMGGYLTYFAERDVFTSSLAKAPESPAPVYACPWIASNLYIGSEGTVFPCMQFAGLPGSAAFPNLRDLPLARILRDSALPDIARIKTETVWAHGPECLGCPERGRHCGKSCRACTGPEFLDVDASTCLFVRNEWFRRVQKAVESAGGKYLLE